MDGFQNGKMLRIFVDEHDRHGVEPLYTAVVEVLRKRGVAGAPVLRGIEGFGTHHRIHVAKPFSAAPNSPVLIEVVDEEDRLRALIPELKKMIGEGLISLENISYLRLQRP